MLCNCELVLGEYESELVAILADYGLRNTARSTGRKHIYPSSILVELLQLYWTTSSLVRDPDGSDTSRTTTGTTTTTTTRSWSSLPLLSRLLHIHLAECKHLHFHQNANARLRFHCVYSIVVFILRRHDSCLVSFACRGRGLCVGGEKTSSCLNHKPQTSLVYIPLRVFRIL
jgi:hypothetical protein